VNVTPNRPDALSHLGIAREVSVLTREPLRPPSPKLAEGGGKAADKVKLRVEDPSRCPRYAARVVEGVTVGPSPRWLTDRLKACGVRAINNVVDVTNYVLLEYGQPLHGFDLDKVGGAEIVVRLARMGEHLTTLDGKDRALDPDDLLICDRDKPQVLAGVMGGAQSEVTQVTRRVLLEGAYFQPKTVRRASKRHSLHTESSHRFERGTDVGIIPAALDRAAALIAELGGGQVLEGRVDAYPKPVERRQVSLRYARVGAVLGVDIPAAESRRILEALGFVLKGDETVAGRFEVPTARVDVEREEDLIEEIARIHGYDAIPEALPRSTGELSPEPRPVEIERRLRLSMSGAGLDEVVNYSFVSPRELVALGQPVPVPLLNPLSAEQSVMRTTLYAGLLQNVSRNLRHQMPSLRLYELGYVYLGDPEGGIGERPVARESLKLSGVLCGSRQGRAWTAKDAPVDFFDAKGAVEVVLAALKIDGAVFEPVETAQYHPRASAVVKAQGKVLGAVGEVDPRVARKLDVPAGLFLFELDVAALGEAADLVPGFKPLSRFPAVLRDLAVVVPVELAHAEVRKVLLEVGAPLVEEAAIFDVYTGQPIPEGKKNVAYALTYRAADRTLTDAEVSEAHGRIVAEVNRRLGGSLRGANPQ
ncbi:MAG: phenylalanine--tRNA ligase subunit beta, partial [Myxococcaceae bacterium]